MRRDYQEFLSRDAEILAIGAATPSAVTSHWQREDIPFPGLANPTKSVLYQFGQQWKLLRFGRMPGVVIIDKDGILRMVHHGRSQTDIPANRVILERLDELNRERERGTRHRSRARG